MRRTRLDPAGTAPRAGFESRVLAAFAAAGLTVLLLGATTWKLSRDAEEAALRVSHTHAVLDAMSVVRGNTVQTELSTRNFRQTGEPSHLARRDAAIAAREIALQDLTRLTDDNPVQQTRLEMLRAVVEERKAISQRVEQLRKAQGEAAASAWVATAPLRQTEERLFLLLDAMQEEERRLLDARSAGYARARQTALAASTSAALALFTLLVVTYALIRRQLRAVEAGRRALAEREIALREVNVALERSDRMKSDFLASMSHELRTPLNAIIGFSEVLRDGLAGAVTPRQREYLQDISNSGTHLLALINDILDLSKVEAGKMTLEPENVPVDSHMKAALSIVREKATAHRLALELQVSPDCGEIRADGRKFKQIVYNLLSNAVKFTPEGGRVVLGARRVSAREVPRAAAPDGPPEFLEISVADTGIGISAEHQERLFSAFTQIDSSLARHYEGTGLGLALVKRLTELHGGAVGLESTPGQGSTFRVWLPYRPARISET